MTSNEPQNLPGENTATSCGRVGHPRCAIEVGSPVAAVKTGDQGVGGQGGIRRWLIEVWQRRAEEGCCPRRSQPSSPVVITLGVIALSPTQDRL